MKAFKGKKEIKKKYLDRVIAHRKADEIVKGAYWENGKGCAVGHMFLGHFIALPIDPVEFCRNGDLESGQAWQM